MPTIAGSTPILGFVAPTDTADTYPSHTEEYGKGGYRTVATINERNDITTGRRKAGMLVKVLSNGITYTLGAGLLDADWEAVSTVSTKSTISDLAAMSGTGITTGTVFKVRGRSSVDDGGGGEFYYDASSSVTADGSMVIEPATGGGRFLRIWETTILPQWFGADDAGITDAATALQNAINFASRPTYGWQSTVGVLAQTGYSGSFTVKANGTYALYSPVYITDGVILEGKPGVMWGEFTGHTLFNIKHGGSGFIISLYNAANGYRIGGIKHVFMVGYPQTYQQNKKTITAVTDRLTFKVADADAPPTLDDTTIRPGNNTCFFYDANNEYLGSARIASTSSSLGQTTVVLHNGTDAYTSINGTSGGALTTACTVVWPVRVTNEFTTVAPAFNDPALAGTVGINVQNLRTGVAVGAGNPVLEDIEGNGFHCTFRFGPGTAGSTSPLNSLRSTRHKFAGFSCSRPENVADLVFSGQTYANGSYTIDPTQSLAVGASLTVTAATPAVFTKTSHGYIAGSGIRFGASTVPTGLTAGTMYYVSATGLTANTFQVSASVGGASIGLSSTGSGLYVAGNVFDYPVFNNGTYGIYGLPDLARYDTVVAEWASLANVYSFRTLGPHIKYLYCDAVGRYGLMMNAGYSVYSAPTSTLYTDWIGVDHMLVKLMGTGTPIDTFHTDSVAVYYEVTDVTLFAGLAVNQLSIASAGNKFTYAFNLQHPNYNNVAKIGMILESNGYTTWYKTGPGKAPDVDAPNLTLAADVYTGWYGPALNQRDFAVTGTRIASFTAGNLLLEASTGRPLTLKSTTTGTAPQSVIGNNIFTWENTVDSLRFGGWYSDSSTASCVIGHTAFTGAARTSSVAGEAMSGTDKNSGDLYIKANTGTGAGSSGSIFLQTGTTTASGTTVHTLSNRVMVPNAGGLRIIASAADIAGSGVGHINYVSGSINNLRFWDRDAWQPLSPNSAEQSIASASTVNLTLSTSEKIFLTGTTTITGFGAAQSGIRRFVRFEGALTLTHSVNLVCPGSINIVTEAGDTAEVHSFGSSSWRIVNFNRATGSALIALNPVATISVDASATFTFLPASSSPTQVLTAAITAGRTVTLSSTSAKNGHILRFTRTAASTGAFNWDIGGLKNLTAGTWCQVAYDGSAWVLLQYGSL